MHTTPPFHLAFAVDDLAAARKFYINTLGCREGRSDTRWVDFDLYGHQLVAHLVESRDITDRGTNTVDGHQVPVPHFGVVLDWQTWTELADRLSASGVKFIIEPYIRFANQKGEQATMFLRDPAGNALEFKAFKDPQQIFTT